MIPMAYWRGAHTPPPPHATALTTVRHQQQALRGVLQAPDGHQAACPRHVHLHQALEHSGAASGVCPGHQLPRKFVAQPHLPKGVMHRHTRQARHEKRPASCTLLPSQPTLSMRTPRHVGPTVWWRLAHRASAGPARTVAGASLGTGAPSTSTASCKVTLTAGEVTTLPFSVTRPAGRGGTGGGGGRGARGAAGPAVRPA